MVYNMRKGMSQTLALIVAASVLMMTALTVIFMVQGGLTDTNQGVTSSSCIQSIEARCSAPTVDQIRAPPSCFSNGEPVGGAPSGLTAQDESSEINCNSVLGGNSGPPVPGG